MEVKGLIYNKSNNKEFHNNNELEFVSDGI